MWHNGITQTDVFGQIPKTQLNCSDCRIVQGVNVENLVTTDQVRKPKRMVNKHTRFRTLNDNQASRKANQPRQLY